MTRFKEKCNDKNIKIFCYDATKAVIEREHSFPHTDGPPFEENYFDRILLDTPCSALGQRPQLYNAITSTQLRSYIPLQRSLFSAVSITNYLSNKYISAICTHRSSFKKNKYFYIGRSSFETKRDFGV